MRRIGKKPPSYRFHKPSGRAVVTLDGRDFYLGPYGSDESKAEYDRLPSEWLAHRRQLPGSSGPVPGLTVSELIVRYWRFAEGHYHRDGEPTRHLQNIRDAIRPARALYGHAEAASFGAASLEAVRRLMIESGLARGTIANRVGKVRQLFRWAVENELVAPATYQALMPVAGLRKGRDGVRETAPVRPVSPEQVGAVMPFLSAPIAGMARLQLLTAMRPGEAVSMKPEEIDLSGELWVYRPSRHKSDGHDRARAITIGPRAQEVLRPFLNSAGGSAYIFNPRAAAESRNERRRAARKTPISPSQRERRRAVTPKRSAGASYSRSAYRSAIWRACDKAFPHPTISAIDPDELNEAQRAELTAWQKAHRWHSNRLRHTAATIIRSKYGLEAAQSVLGHARADVTQVYAERDLAKAHEVMGEIG